MFKNWFRKQKPQPDAEKLLNDARLVLHEWRRFMPEEQRIIAEHVIGEMDAAIDNGSTEMSNHGGQNLSLWFGLSYAKFMCLPRVMMEQMPDRWQMRMATLLAEYDEHWLNAPEHATSFTIRGVGPQGRMAKLDPVLLNYRHPDYETLAEWQRDPCHEDFGKC